HIDDGPDDWIVPPAPQSPMRDRSTVPANNATPRVADVLASPWRDMGTAMPRPGAVYPDDGTQPEKNLAPAHDFGEDPSATTVLPVQDFGEEAAAQPYQTLRPIRRAAPASPSRPSSGLGLVIPQAGWRGLREAVQETADAFRAWHERRNEQDDT